MKKHVVPKRNFYLTCIIAYGAVLYLTFFLLYLHRQGIISGSFPLDDVIRNIYAGILGIYSVKYFFTAIFFNSDLIQIEFFPIRMKRVFLRDIGRYNICVGLIWSVWFLAKVLLYGEIGPEVKTFLICFLAAGSVTNVFLCVFFFGLGKYVGKVGLLFIERILYVSFVVLYPTIINTTLKFEQISILFGFIFLGTAVMFFCVRDEKYKKCLYDVCGDINERGSYNNKKINRSEWLFERIDAYCMLELKRYMAIGKVLLSVLIQFIITTALLLSFYSQKGRGTGLLFIVLNMIASNNFFATTAYSSDQIRECAFYPIRKGRYFLTKVMFATILQSILFTITYCVALFVLKEDIMFHEVAVFLLLLLLVFVYSCFGCLLDIIFRKKTKNMSELLYGNLPKLLLVIVAMIFSGILVSLC